MKPFMIIKEEKDLNLHEYFICVSKQFILINSVFEKYKFLVINNRSSSYVFIDNLWYNKSFQNEYIKMHRVNGPAIIDCDGIEEYYLNGKYFTKKEWEKNRKKFL